MDWLRAMDLAAYRWVHEGMRHPWLDTLAALFSWNGLLALVVVLAVAGVIWRGSQRARICLGLVVLAVLAGEVGVYQPLKRGIGRLRPEILAETENPDELRRNRSSMPSSHAGNWFAAAMVLGMYYRRSWRYMAPAGTLAAFSRVYQGAHYPADVVAGALLGIAVGYGVVRMASAFWEVAGARWFPCWWRRCRSLRVPDAVEAVPKISEDRWREERHRQWRSLAYVAIGLILAARLIYVGSDTIELSEDEAYQWLWSKRLDWSYYSKPPMIACAQWLGTHLWGDREFGVRFWSPVIAAVLGLVLYRHLARELHPGAGLAMVVIGLATPLLAAGSVLMTIDPLSVVFWTAAMISGLSAVRSGSTAAWVWTGAWMGLGFLSKYVALFQWASWALFFVLWPDARRQLRRPGPYLALAINLACMLPVIGWNVGHDWVTVTHVAQVGHVGREWQFTVKYLADFVAVEAGLLHPIFFAGAAVAAFAFWQQRGPAIDGARRMRRVFYFCMGAPVFGFYALYTMHSRVQPNWIAPAVVPLFCLMVDYWESRWREGLRWLRPLFVGGAAAGISGVLLLHNTNLLIKLTGRALPVEVDPLRRVRGWAKTARVTGEARERLEAEGRPAFIIGDHYGIVGQLSFYLPEAKAGVPDDPMVYYQTTDQPRNQFYFWPGYRERRGQNAIYVLQTDTPQPAPEAIVTEFSRVEDWGLREIQYRDRVMRRIQIFACRELR